MSNEKPDTGYVSAVREKIGEIDAKDLLVSVAVGLVPAIVLAVELAFAAREGSAWMFWLPWVGFTYLVYRHRPLRNKASAVSFYLAMESFLLPVAALTSTFIFAGEQESGFGQLGAAIGGGLITVAAAVVGFAVGIVLYLVSDRLEIEKVETVEVESDE